MLLMALCGLFELLFHVGIAAGSCRILKALDQKLLSAQRFGEQSEFLCSEIYHFK